MIEASAATNLFGGESIGGGLYPAELAERERRVRRAKRPETARYCENPDCRVLKLTGERQRLRGLNGVITERGTYRGVRISRVCSWCERSSVVELDQESEQEESEEKCIRGHSIARFGRYDSGECKECKREDNERRREGEQLGRLSHRHSYMMLSGLDALKKEWGGSYPALARAIGHKTNTLKSWAYLDCAAPPDAVENLVGVLGCTAAELSGTGEATS